MIRSIGLRRVFTSPFASRPAIPRGLNVVLPPRQWTMISLRDVRSALASD